jgi:T4-like virus tail tube protein gp19
MPPGAGSYTASHFALEVGGTFVAPAMSVEGGAVAGRVVGTDQGSPPVRRKNLGGVDFEPIVVEVGADAGPQLLTWIKETLENKLPRRDGRIVFFNYNVVPQATLAWTDGLLTEIRFPELDASSREVGKIRLTIEAEAIDRSTGGSASTYSGMFGKQKTWLANNYRLTLSSMNTAPGYVSWIGPITVKQPYVAPPGPGGSATATASLDVSDLSVAVWEAKADEFYDWHRSFVIQGQTGPGNELTGRLEFLDQTRANVLFGLDFMGLGIQRIGPERRMAGIETTALARADIYCEEVSLIPPLTTSGTGSGAAGSGAAGSGAGSSPTGTPQTPSTVGAELVELLRAAIVGGGAKVVADRPESDAAFVTERLIRSSEASDATDGTATVVNERIAVGRRIGADWARERATLDELEEIAAVASTEWTALILGAGHSLVRDLLNNGIISAEPVAEEVVLERDSFVEAVVDGASEVYAEVRPVLRERGVRAR